MNNIDWNYEIEQFIFERISWIKVWFQWWGGKEEQWDARVCVFVENTKKKKKNQIIVIACLIYSVHSDSLIAYKHTNDLHDIQTENIYLIWANSIESNKSFYAVE